jgi:hypothetical protein
MYFVTRLGYLKPFRTICLRRYLKREEITKMEKIA